MTQTIEKPAIMTAAELQEGFAKLLHAAIQEEKKREDISTNSAACESCLIRVDTVINRTNGRIHLPLVMPTCGTILQTRKRCIHRGDPKFQCPLRDFIQSNVNALSFLQEKASKILESLSEITIDEGQKFHDFLVSIYIATRDESFRTMAQTFLRPPVRS